MRVPFLIFRWSVSNACSEGPAAGLRPVMAVFVAVVMLLVAPPADAQQEQEGPASPTDVAMVVHGGAGSIEEANMTAEEEEAYRAKLTEALRAGYAVIQEGGASREAVVAAITLMESSPLFNAGRGAVFTNQGTVEHDASLMEGDMRRAGAVAGVKHIQHPIQLARLVMEESKHVMLAREGAEEFALAQGMDLVPNSYFYSEERRERFLRDLTSSRGAHTPNTAMPPAKPARPGHLGTVGAVALDQEGTLAAGTSTGGMSNKQWGRIGDSPIIGAGSYADNETCAVSSTGWGEYFIRGVIPHDIASMMRYAGASLREAAHTVVTEKLPQIGDGRGSGGVIALDAEGNAAMPFTTPGMFRGYITGEGDVTVRLYDRETRSSE